MTKELQICKFKIDKGITLGHGSLGIVYSATNICTHKKLAAKCLSINGKDTDIKLAQKEIEILKDLQSDHVVRLFEAESYEASFWIILEFCDLGDLETYFVRHSPSRNERIRFMTHMADGLKFLHKNNIVHRNIKPGNILLSSSKSADNAIAKISDFSLAKVVETCTNETFGRTFLTSCGSPMFMAPELFTPNVDRNESVDIFAMGLTYLAMTCFKKGQGRLVPFDDPTSTASIGSRMHEMTLYGTLEKTVNISHNVVSIAEDCPQVERRVRELVRNMILYNPADRWHSTDVRREIKKIYYDSLEEVGPAKSPSVNGESSSDAQQATTMPVESNKGEFRMTAVDKIGIFDVDISAHLGKGSISVVFTARNNKTNAIVAAKRYTLDEETAELYQTECLKFKEVLSPYVARVDDCIINSNSTWLLMEMFNFGDLENYLLSYTPVEEEVVTLMTHMAAGVNYLHEKGIIHMDIKPQNVLIKSSVSGKYPTAKIADFGFLKILKCPVLPLYTAPETFANSTFSAPADIFSLGLIFFATIIFERDTYRRLIPCDDPNNTIIAVGEYMYTLAEFDQLERAKVFHENIVTQKDGCTKTESQIRDLVKKMILYEANKRWSSSEVVEKINEIHQDCCLYENDM